MRRIGILTGGGDCPGLNAVIRGVVKSALLVHGWDVIGIEDGFDGLLAPEKCRPLSPRPSGTSSLWTPTENWSGLQKSWV